MPLIKSFPEGCTAKQYKKGLNIRLSHNLRFFAGRSGSRRHFVNVGKIDSQSPLHIPGKHERLKEKACNRKAPDSKKNPPMKRFLFSYACSTYPVLAEHIHRHRSTPCNFEENIELPLNDMNPNKKGNLYHWPCGRKNAHSLKDIIRLFPCAQNARENGNSPRSLRHCVYGGTVFCC